MTDKDEHLIMSYLQGKLSPESRKEFESWRNESDENQRMVDHFQKIWRLTGSADTDLDFQPEEEWKKLSSSLSETREAPERKLVTGTWWLKIAAAIVFILLASGALYLTIFKTGEVIVQTTDNTVRTVLPDGSVIWLNSASSLSYTCDNFEENRFVNLEGEAFFDVKKNPAKPFVIRTQGAQVKVLGTSFNVKAYSKEVETVVVVLTGSVNFGRDDKSEQVILAPGIKGVLNKNDQSLITASVEDDNTLSWKNKQLVFNKTPLQKVIKDLRSYFKKEIRVKSDKILPCRFTGSFQDPTLDEVLETLGIALDLKVSQDEDSYVLEGTGCEEL